MSDVVLQAGSSSSVYCILCQAGTYGTGSGQGVLEKSALIDVNSWHPNSFSPAYD